MLWRKTYVSTANRVSFRDDLPAILETSRARNDVEGVTGVLLIAGGSYYQTLEGDRSDVEATFKRISSDRRHDGMIALQDEAAAGRAFAGWSMAHRDLPANHRIADLIGQISPGQTLATRTNTAAKEIDILISTFLTV